MKRIVSLLLVTALVALLAVGCGNQNSNTGTPDNTATATENITVEQAKEIALADAGLTEAEVNFLLAGQEIDDGVAIYEVEFYKDTTEYDYTIAVADGTILSKDADMETALPATDATANADGTLIGEDQAKQVALTAAGLAEADVSRLYCSLERDDGITSYDVSFRAGSTEHDYEINAATGNILSQEQESIYD